MLWVKILRLIFLLLTYLIFKTSSYWVMTFYTTQTMKFSTKDFFIKCGQIHRKRLIGSHLLKKYLMENFIFCALLKLTELEHFSILKTLPSGSSSQYAHTKITRIRPPPLPPCTQSYGFGLTLLYVYALSIFYSDSSFHHSQFLGSVLFLLVSEVKFH